MRESAVLTGFLLLPFLFHQCPPDYGMVPLPFRVGLSPLLYPWKCPHRHTEVCIANLLVSLNLNHHTAAIICSEFTT
jgi:hypothetical protein